MIEAPRALVLLAAVAATSPVFAACDKAQVRADNVRVRAEVEEYAALQGETLNQFAASVDSPPEEVIAFTYAVECEVRTAGGALRSLQNFSDKLRESGDSEAASQSPVIVRKDSGTRSNSDDSWCSVLKARKDQSSKALADANCGN
jgi:hypothetical protein